MFKNKFPVGCAHTIPWFHVVPFFFLSGKTQVARVEHIKKKNALNFFPGKITEIGLAARSKSVEFLFFLCVGGSQSKFENTDVYATMSNDPGRHRNML